MVSKSRGGCWTVVKVEQNKNLCANSEGRGGGGRTWFEIDGGGGG